MPNISPRIAGASLSVPLEALAPWAGLALFLVFTALLYAPGLAGGFVFDDFPNLLENDAVRGARPTLESLWQAAVSSVGGFRPLAYASFALQMAFSGPSPGPFKAVNLTIHLVNGALLFAWLRLLTYAPRVAPTLPETARRWLPLFVSALWLIAPIQLTAVLYVVQRMESLAVSFTLAGLLLYTLGRLRMQNRGRGRVLALGGLLLMTLLALTSKETGVLVPVYACALEFFAFGFRTGGKTDVGLVRIFILVAAAPALVGLAATLPGALSGEAYRARPFTLEERLFTEARILVDYLRSMVLPDLTRLSLYHDDFPLSRGLLQPPATLAALLGLGTLLAFAVWVRRRAPLVGLGIVFFFIGHALVSTYLPLELYHEHRNLAPSAGIFLALVAGAFHAAPTPGARRLAALALAALVVMQAFTTALRSREWSDPVRLALTAASRHPDSPRANYDLGLLLVVVGRTPEDPRFQLGMQSFEAARRLPGASLLPTAALLFTASRHGLPVEDAWWQSLQAGLQKPALGADDVNALYTLVRCAAQKHCSLDAPRFERVLAAGLARHPEHAILHTLAANWALNVRGDGTLAEGHMQRALALDPKNPQYWANLIELQLAARHVREARASLARLSEIDRLGRFASRAAEWQRRLRSLPDA